MQGAFWIIQGGSCGTFIDLARTEPMALRRNERESKRAMRDIKTLRTGEQS